MEMINNQLKVLATVHVSNLNPLDDSSKGIVAWFLAIDSSFHSPAGVFQPYDAKRPDQI